MNLWMRWLDFRALRDLLLLVGRHAEGLSASKLEQLANDEGVLLRRDGQPYARSIHYHHRRTLERLELLQKCHRNLVLNISNPDTMALTDDSRFREQLLPSEKAAFANAVIRNKDCHEAFVAHFMPRREQPSDAADFIKRGRHVQIAIRTSCDQPLRTDNIVDSSSNGTYPKQVAIRSAKATRWSVTSGIEAIQAIHFGIRSWCADQLSFVEIVYRADGTYFAYPKCIATESTNQELAKKMFADLDFTEKWATTRIPDFALATGIKHRVSIEQAKDVLLRWLTEHPDLVAGVPSRVRFITAGLTDRQRTLTLKSYLQHNDGAYLSHIRIHQHLGRRLQEGTPNS